MFFFLSKVLDYALLPLLWIGVVFLYALLTKKPVRRKRSIIAGLIMLFFFGNGFIINEATYFWQKDPVLISQLKASQTAIILAGIVPYQAADDADRVHISNGSDRLLHTVQLYKAGKVNTILISGGSGTLVGNKSSEAYKLKSILLYCGVQETDILLEPVSRNTHESSVLTRKLIDSLKIRGDFLLVTSAIHMRRAQDCFTKAGLKTDIFPVDFVGHGQFDLDQLIPTEAALSNWTALIREMVGYYVYKIMGYC